MAFSIKSLDHVVLRVADLLRAARFYREVLGCGKERRVEPFDEDALRRHLDREGSSDIQCSIIARELLP